MLVFTNQTRLYHRFYYYKNLFILRVVARVPEDPAFSTEDRPLSNAYNL